MKSKKLSIVLALEIFQHYHQLSRVSIHFNQKIGLRIFRNYAGKSESDTERKHNKRLHFLFVRTQKQAKNHLWTKSKIETHWTVYRLNEFYILIPPGYFLTLISYATDWIELNSKFQVLTKTWPYNFNGTAIKVRRHVKIIKSQRD